VTQGNARKQHQRRRNFEEAEEKLMRKIDAGLFLSLDGVMESPDQWHFAYFDDETGEVVGAREKQ
jgi:hypothetical protein